MSVFYQVYFILLFITLILYSISLQGKERHTKWIVLLMILWLLTSAIAIYLSLIAKWKNNLFVFHISTPLEYCIIAMMYKQEIVNQRVKKLIVISIPIFFVLCIASALSLQKPNVNNSYMMILESVMIILISLYYFREILLLQQIPVLYRFTMFWISVGILFYYIGNLLIEGMLNYMIAHSIDLARRAYNFGHVFEYLLFTLLIVGVLSNKNSFKVKD